MKLKLKGLSLKILILSIIPLILMSIGAFVVFKNLKTVENKLHATITETAPSLVSSKDLIMELKVMELNVYKIINIDHTDQEALSNAIFDFEDSFYRFNEGFERYNKIPMVSVAETLRARAFNYWKMNLETVESFVTTLKTQNDTEIKNLYEQKISHIYFEINDILSAVEINNLNLLEAENTNLSVLKKTVLYETLLAASLGILISIGASLFFSQKINKQLFNFTDKINSIVGLLINSSKDLNTISQHLSASATQQAASLQETASATEEVNTMVKQNTEASNQVANVSRTNLAVVQNGENTIKDMSLNVEEIKESVDELIEAINASNHEVEDILLIIKTIGEKTKIINDIVFQTKLLSFNASVEAARAGEHGKGFAVVAEEVGKLAKLSGHAAEEISSLLEENLRAIQSIVDNSKNKSVEISSKNRGIIQKGFEGSKLCEQSFKDIFEKTSVITGLINEVQHAGNEQANGISEITKAISQLDQATHEIAQNATKTSDSSVELSRLVEELADVSSELLLMVNGRH